MLPVALAWLRRTSHCPGARAAALRAARRRSGLPTRCRGRACRSDARDRPSGPRTSRACAAPRAVPGGSGERPDTYPGADRVRRPGDHQAPHRARLTPCRDEERSRSARLVRRPAARAGLAARRRPAHQRPALRVHPRCAAGRSGLLLRRHPAAAAVSCSLRTGRHPPAHDGLGAAVRRRARGALRTARRRCAPGRRDPAGAPLRC